MGKLKTNTGRNGAKISLKRRGGVTKLANQKRGKVSKGRCPESCWKGFCDVSGLGRPTLKRKEGRVPQRGTPQGKVGDAQKDPRRLPTSERVISRTQNFGVVSGGGRSDTVWRQTEKEGRKKKEKGFVICFCHGTRKANSKGGVSNSNGFLHEGD